MFGRWKRSADLSVTIVFFFDPGKYPANPQGFLLRKIGEAVPTDWSISAEESDYAERKLGKSKFFPGGIHMRADTVRAEDCSFEFSSPQKIGPLARHAKMWEKIRKRLIKSVPGLHEVRLVFHSSDSLVK